MVFFRNGDLKDFTSAKEKKRPMSESLFNKVEGLHWCNFIMKTTLAQLFSIKLCNFLQNKDFIEYLRTTASSRALAFTKTVPKTIAIKWFILYVF